MTTTTGWSPASGESEEGETEILQGGADSPQDLVDIHSVLNNKHVQLSIVYMRNLLTCTCVLHTIRKLPIHFRQKGGLKFKGGDSQVQVTCLTCLPFSAQHE